MIKIKENINNVDEFNLLYDLVGWGAYDKEISRKALNNTYYSVSVYDDNKIIGYGRKTTTVEDVKEYAEYFELVEEKHLTPSKAMKLMKVGKTTYYKYKKIWEENIKK